MIAIISVWILTINIIGGIHIHININIMAIIKWIRVGVAAAAAAAIACHYECKMCYLFITKAAQNQGASKSD